MRAMHNSAAFKMACLKNQDVPVRKDRTIYLDQLVVLQMDKLRPRKMRKFGLAHSESGDKRDFLVKTRTE